MKLIIMLYYKVIGQSVVIVIFEHDQAEQDYRSVLHCSEEIKHAMLSLLLSAFKNDKSIKYIHF